MFDINGVYKALKQQSALQDKSLEFRPLKFRGEVVEDYFVDSQGNVWSTKRRNPEMLTASSSGNKYLAVCIQVNKKSYTIDIHRLVCETWYEKDRPNNIPKQIWDNAHDILKECILESLEVNHIDHDTSNYHPSNLEWVTRKENNQKSHMHYHGGK
jgi:hypothetical protein